MYIAKKLIILLIFCTTFFVFEYSHMGPSPKKLIFALNNIRLEKSAVRARQGNIKNSTLIEFSGSRCN